MGLGVGHLGVSDCSLRRFDLAIGLLGAFPNLCYRHFEPAFLIEPALRSATVPTILPPRKTGDERSVKRRNA
jgi:hypothetical protein